MPTWFVSGLGLAHAKSFFFFNIRIFSQLSALQRRKPRRTAAPSSAEQPTLGLTPLSSPSLANPEDQWQREISEKGEVACPTCSVITRKTVVGLKKHMDVCQKVRVCFIQSHVDFGMDV